MNEEKKTELKVKKDKKPRVKKKERAKKSSGFNILDVLIAAGLLIFVAVIVLVYSPVNLFNINSEDCTIIYSVCISGVTADYAGTVKVGDVVTDADGYRLGTVVSDVEIEAHVVYEYREGDDGNGSIAKITHPELVDLTITISADAKINGDGFTVDGKRIALEAEYDLVFPGLESKGVCVSLSEEKSNDAGAAK